jgi:peptidoglycan/xylan/chitin deacetylase (PgdA/CDA1 family)
MKRFLFALIYRCALVRLVSWLNRKSVPILCYHSVIDGDRPLSNDPHKQHIPLTLFLAHLTYLQKHHHLVSLDEFQAARRQNRTLPDYSVVITFDDGFEDFYTVVAPHLLRRNVPATVFVITDRASRFLPLNGESFLSWKEIRELVDSGLSVGSHTCTHPQLPDLSVPDAMRELADSLAAVQTQTQQSRVALSYPFGQTSEPVARMAETSGYSCAIADDCGPNHPHTNLFELSRTVIASDDDIATFAARVSGLTWWISNLRQAVYPRGKRRLPHQSSKSTLFAHVKALIG